MKTLLATAVIVVLAICPAIHSAPIKVADTGVTFEAPKDFRPLSKAVMAKKWPTKGAPDHAVGTPSGTTNIAYGLKPDKIPQEALPEVQKQFTQLFERMIPKLEWKKNEIIEQSGQKWLLLEMTSAAVDTDIYNIMLVTGYKDKTLVFNFNSTKEEFPKYEAALRASVASVQLPK